VHIRTSEFKTEYRLFKGLKRIAFMALGAVEMMRFLYAKIYLKGGNSDIKICQKSGNLVGDFLRYSSRR